MNSTLKEAERLHKLGFAILWIKPKSKAPVKPKWTTGPREEWAALKSSFRPEFNVGVRLGAPSVVGGKHLAVIDVDVKSTDPIHQAEAEKAVRELFPQLPETAPTVLSGRGNGSSHIYILTDKPAQPSKRKVSSERVRVMMPSAGINQSQREQLSEEDLNEGWRMRPAWEIAVMGEGQQVVLPPSTHPDSGRAYIWKVHVKGDGSDLVELEVGHKQKDVTREMTFDWVPEDFDLTFSTLPDDIVNDILYADVENRSDSLLFVAEAMIAEGLTDRQIMSVLTDPTYALAKTSYDHAKTDSRARAANWLFNYTIKKARKNVDAQLQFTEEVEVVTLSEEDSKKQTAELITPVDWKSKLDRTQKGKTTATLKNILLILQNTISPKVFKRDSFALKDKYGCNTPWGGIENRDIIDADILKMKVWFIDRHNIEPDKSTLEDAVGYIGLLNSYHPVRDYLRSLEWDGTPRIDTWLKTYLKADAPEPYLSAVSRKTLCAMVARIFVPGIKFDHVLIMNGAQGIGKSTAARILASSKWFMDRLPDLRDKDAMINLQGIWVVEMGELANMRQSTVETYKAFLTSQIDKFRLPYGRRREDFERQCVIMGSSNPVEFLNDPTGNRRFWPVKVKQCDFEALTRDRDQLLAEAKWVWENCAEPLYLNEREEKQAKEIQAVHTQDDIDTDLEERWDEYVEDCIEKGETNVFEKFKLEALFGVGGVFEFLSFSKDAKRVAKLLRKKGFEKIVITGNKKRWNFKRQVTEHPPTLN